jgi:hypothetical protein
MFYVDLKVLCAKKGITLNQLSIDTKIDRKVIGAYCKRPCPAVHFNLSNLEKIYKYFGLSNVSDLIKVVE